MRRSNSTVKSLAPPAATVKPECSSRVQLETAVFVAGDIKRSDDLACCPFVEDDLGAIDRGVLHGEAERAGAGAAATSVTGREQEGGEGEGGTGRVLDLDLEPPCKGASFALGLDALLTH